MLTFKPTVTSIIAAAILCIAILWHIPVAAIAPVISISMLLSTMGYFVGRAGFLKEQEGIQIQAKLLIEAELLEEISKSSLVELFPDIQRELLRSSAEKFEELGDELKSNDLRAEAIQL